MITSNATGKILLNNIITSGMKNYDIDIMRKVKMINAMSIIAILIIVPFGLDDLIKGYYAIGIFVHVIAAVLIFNLLYLRKSGNYLFPIYCGTSIVAVYYIYALVTGGINNTGYLWFFTFPLFALFLLGSKKGAAAALLLLIPPIAFFSIRLDSSTFSAYSMDFKIRFILSYLVVLSFAYLFETLKEKAQRTLSAINDDLQRTIADLQVTEEKLKKSGEELEQKVIERTDNLANTLNRLNRELKHRKQTEDALKESEEKYRSLVESTEDSIYLLDRNCAYLFMSKKHLSRLGLAAEKAVGRTYAEFHSEDNTKELIGKVEEVFKTGKSLSYEYRSERDSGYYIRTLSPVKEPDGRTVSITVVSKDITERKKAEEALKESEEFNKALFEYNPIETVVVDLEGRVTSFNLAKKNSGDRLPNIGDVMYKDYAGKHEIDMYAELMKCIRSGKTMRLPEQKYGDKLLSITLSPFYKGAIITSQDITERKKSEEELDRSREQLRNLTAYLQSVREQERTNIAREIHDDLGQTLTALKMDISWLGKKLPKDQETLLEKTKAMTKLTDMTIKTVKRISTELRPGLLDDLGLVAAIEWQAEEFQHRMGMRCELTVDPEEIILDQDRSTAIFRIFQETLTNIARHAKATRVTASLKEKDDKLELRVRDNGSGITKEQISDSKSFGLMGIRERVHPWGGQVKISGKPGKGTTWW